MFFSNGPRSHRETQFSKSFITSVNIFRCRIFSDHINEKKNESVKLFQVACKFVQDEKRPFMCHNGSYIIKICLETYTIAMPYVCFRIRMHILQTAFADLHIFCQYMNLFCLFKIRVENSEKVAAV